MHVWRDEGAGRIERLERETIVAFGFQPIDMTEDVPFDIVRTDLAGSGWCDPCGQRAHVVLACRSPYDSSTISGIAAGCCAHAATGHAAAAPPSVVMNSRRQIIRSPRRSRSKGSHGPRSERDHGADPRFSACISLVLHMDPDNDFTIFGARA